MHLLTRKIKQNSVNLQISLHFRRSTGREGKKKRKRGEILMFYGVKSWLIKRLVFRDTGFTCALTLKSWVLYAIVCGKMMFALCHSHEIWEAKVLRRLGVYLPVKAFLIFQKERRICLHSFLDLCDGAAHPNDNFTSKLKRTLWNRVNCCFYLINHINFEDFYGLSWDRFIVIEILYLSAFYPIS